MIHLELRVWLRLDVLGVQWFGKGRSSPGFLKLVGILPGGHVVICESPEVVEFLLRLLAEGTAWRGHGGERGERRGKKSREYRERMGKIAGNIGRGWEKYLGILGGKNLGILREGKIPGNIGKEKYLGRKNGNIGREKLGNIERGKNTQEYRERMGKIPGNIGRGREKYLGISGEGKTPRNIGRAWKKHLRTPGNQRSREKCSGTLGEHGNRTWEHQDWVEPEPWK